MATVEPYCTTRGCSSVPAWFPEGVKRVLNHCPACGARLHFRCSACERGLPGNPDETRAFAWCPFCGGQFGQPPAGEPGG